MTNNEYSIETTGATVEEAIQTGLEKLGVGPGQVIVEVMEEPSRGLFGLGSKQARVRLQRLTPPPSRKPEAAPRPPAPSQPKAEQTSQPPAAVTSDKKISEAEVYGDDDDFFDDDGSYGEPESTETVASSEDAAVTPVADEQDEGVEEEAKPDNRKRRSRKRSSRRGEGLELDNSARKRHNQSQGRGGRGGRRQSGRRGGKREESTVTPPPIEFEDGADHKKMGEQVLVELMDIMDIPSTIETTRSEAADADETPETAPWILNIQGNPNDLSPLIGRKGETLSALQYITRLIVSKQVESRVNLIVDVDEYRLKRSEKISRMANRMADQAVETDSTVRLEPMPPHERRIIHVALRKRDDVDTESTGEGDKRRVTIFPIKKTAE